MGNTAERSCFSEASHYPDTSGIIHGISAAHTTTEHGNYVASFLCFKQWKCSSEQEAHGRTAVMSKASYREKIIINNELFSFCSSFGS